MWERFGWMRKNWNKERRGLEMEEKEETSCYERVLINIWAHARTHACVCVFAVFPRKKKKAWKHHNISFFFFSLPFNFILSCRCWVRTDLTSSVRREKTHVMWTLLYFLSCETCSDSLLFMSSYYPYSSKKRRVWISLPLAGGSWQETWSSTHEDGFYLRRCLVDVGWRVVHGVFPPLFLTTGA